MPWCPICRNEYREGFEVCADCGAKLVEELGEDTGSYVTIVRVPTDHISEVTDFLDASDISAYKVEEVEEGMSEILAEEKNRNEVSFAVNTFLNKRQEEVDELMQKKKDNLAKVLASKEEKKDEKEEADKKEEKKKPETAFRSSKEKADEARNSAIALLLIGIIGLAFEALVVFHVLPLEINGLTGKILYGFMACVFLGLIIGALLSFSTAKRLREAIVDESGIKEEILKFCKEDAVDTALKLIPVKEEEDESVYFARMDFLKSAIRQEPKFKDVDPELIEGLLDENYQELFS